MYTLDRRWLDPRRPRKDPKKLTAEEQEERLIPYMDVLPLQPNSFATYNREVRGGGGGWGEGSGQGGVCAGQTWGHGSPPLCSVLSVLSVHMQMLPPLPLLNPKLASLLYLAGAGPAAFPNPKPQPLSSPPCPSPAASPLPMLA